MKSNSVKTKGFYLSVIAAVLSLAGIVVYRNVTYTNSAVYFVLSIVVIIEALMVGLTTVKGIRAEYNIFMIINTVLTMLGAGLSVASMINEVANTFAGLNEWNVLYAYFLYIALTFLGWLLFLVVTFTGIGGEKE